MTVPTCSALARHALTALFALAGLSLCSVSCADDRFVPRDMRTCTAEQAAAGYDQPCKQPLSAEALAAELEKLKTTNFAHAVSGDTLVVSIRVPRKELAYPNGPYLCCELQAYLDRIGDDVYAARFRWKRMASALLDLQFLALPDRPDARFQHRGSPQFVFAGDKVDAGLIARSRPQLSTGTYAAAGEYDTRKVSVFRGAACRGSLEACTVIYTPDGQDTAAFAHNALAHGIDLDRIVVVGVHHADVDPSGSRIEELVLDANPARYEAFMRFVTRDLKRHIEGESRPRLRIAAGYSNGGAWAYDALVSQGAHFDGAIVMSPAQWRTRGDGSLQGRRVVVGAGYMEPAFYQNALAMAPLLKGRGAAVTELYVPSGHGMNTWVNVWNAALQDFSTRHD